MTWFLHSTVADLCTGRVFWHSMRQSPIIAVIVACSISVRSIDRTRGLELPLIPQKLDPYEIAYLRGGQNEVARVAIASLVQRGVLKITEKGSWNAKSPTIDLGRWSETKDLTPIEACVMKVRRVPRDGPKHFPGLTALP